MLYCQYCTSQQIFAVCVLIQLFLSLTLFYFSLLSFSVIVFFPFLLPFLPPPSLIFIPLSLSPLQNAPHPMYLVTASDWAFPYSREKAAFPAVSTNTRTHTHTHTLHVLHMLNLEAGLFKFPITRSQYYLKLIIITHISIHTVHSHTDTCSSPFNK